MSHTTTEHHGGVSDLEELNAYIERGEAKKVDEMLELKEDMETVFVPFPPAIVNGKALIPSICEAVKKKNLAVMYMLQQHDDSFVCDEEEEEMKFGQGFSSFCWANATIGFNALHMASSLGYSLVSLVLLSWGMDPMIATGQKDGFSVYQRFSPLHLASLNDHLNIFQTLLYFLKNKPQISTYIKQTFKNTPSSKSLDFSRLPSSFVTDTPNSIRPIFDDHGNLLNAEELEAGSAKNALPNKGAQDDLLGDVNLQISCEMFNRLLNKRNASGETALHVAAYHRRENIVHWILTLAVHTNTNFIEDIMHKLMVVLGLEAEEDEGSEKEDTDTDSDASELSIHHLVSNLEKKQRRIIVDEEEDVDGGGRGAMSPLMIAASRGFPELVSAFVEYNKKMESVMDEWRSNLVAEMERKGGNEKIVKKFGHLLPSSPSQSQEDVILATLVQLLDDLELMVMVRFDRSEDKQGDSVLHLACQSQLQRVFNYNYEPSQDHYECIYQIVTRRSADIRIDTEKDVLPPLTESPHKKTLVRQDSKDSNHVHPREGGPMSVKYKENDEGDAAFDLLLSPVANLFQSLHHISFILYEMGSSESIYGAYPSLRDFLEAALQGPHAIRSVPLISIYHILQSHAIDLTSSSFDSLQLEGDIPKFIISDDPLLYTFAFPTSSSSTPLQSRDPSSSSLRESLSSQEGPFFKIPSLPLLCSFAAHLSQILQSQHDVLVQEDAKPCKLIDTTQIPQIRKFEHYRPLLSTSHSPTMTSSFEVYYSTGSSGEEGLSKIADVQSSEISASDSASPPSGHPDVSKYPPGATCPMGFGKKKEEPVTKTNPASSSSDSASPPSGHPDISKYPPGATCPMGFGKKKEEARNTNPSENASSSAPPASAPPSGHPDISKYPPGAVCPMGFGRKKEEEANQKNGEMDASKSPSLSGSPPRFASWLKNYDVWVLLGAASLLSSLVLFRLFKSPSSPRSSNG